MSYLKMLRKVSDPSKCKCKCSLIRKSCFLETSMLLVVKPILRTSRASSFSNHFQESFKMSNLFQSDHVILLL